MKLALGAPVAERAWVLPRWFECLAAQTVQPDHLCFTYTPSEDHTYPELLLGAEALSVDGLSIRESALPYFPRNDRNRDPSDPWRAQHMADLRNELREEFLATEADVLVSLDTDILLNDRTILEQLVQTLQDGWNVATPTTYLHPLGADSGCYNIGFFIDHAAGPTRGWRRATTLDVADAPLPLIRVDIPMAVFAITRRALGLCEYQAHEQGEDVGFAQNLAQHDLRVAWRTDLETQHVWDERALQKEALQA